MSSAQKLENLSDNRFVAGYSTQGFISFAPAKLTDAGTAMMRVAAAGPAKAALGFKNARRHGVADWAGGCKSETGCVAAWLFGLDLPDRPLAPGLFAGLQRSEMAAQAKAIARERPIRLLVVALISAVMSLYLAWSLVLASALAVLLADRIEVLWHQRSYQVTLATVYISELFFCLPAEVVWHSAGPFAKTISVGVFSAAMMRLATIRSIRAGRTGGLGKFDCGVELDLLDQPQQWSGAGVDLVYRIGFAWLCCGGHPAKPSAAAFGRDQQICDFAGH